MELLSEGLKQICLGDKTAGLLVTPRLEEITGLLNLYVKEIERFNSAYGLVKADDRETLIVKHILDSLAPLGHIVRLLTESETSIDSETASLAGKTLADLGSGAGLPGIPLAICLDGVHVTLIERMGRRAGFLRNVCALLGLSHCTVEETELEKFSGSFDLVTFRALSPLTPALIAKLSRLCKPGGIIAAYKGKHETAETELAGLVPQGGGTARRCTTELIPLTVPFLEEQRCLTVIFNDIRLAKFKVV